MMPKIIHCFWAGGPKTKLAERCLASWRRFAPGWEIREWSLSDVGTLQGEGRAFFEAASANRKWAMASDWVRMAVLWNVGGIYLDLDVELIAPIWNLPDGEWVAGEWMTSGAVGMNPGSGIALEKGSPIAAAMLGSYGMVAFDPDREMMPWIAANLSDAIRASGSLRVLAPEVMSPIDVEGRMHRTDRTVGIHWYAMSWCGPKRRFARWLSWHGMRPLVEFLLKLKNGSD